MIFQLSDKLKESKVRGPLRDVNGAYSIKRGSVRLFVIASNGLGWDHVSVSLATRCPTWEEMCFIKSLFFRPGEVVMQLHPAESEYVNNHPFCLHLWRPQTDVEIAEVSESWREEAPVRDVPSPGVIPTPCKELVGIQSLGKITA